MSCMLCAYHRIRLSCLDIDANMLQFAFSPQGEVTCSCAVCKVWKRFVSGKLYGTRIYEILTLEFVDLLAAHIWRVPPSLSCSLSACMSCLPMPISLVLLILLLCAGRARAASTRTLSLRSAQAMAVSAFFLRRGSPRNFHAIASSCQRQATIQQDPILRMHRCQKEKGPAYGNSESPALTRLRVGCQVC